MISVSTNLKTHIFHVLRTNRPVKASLLKRNFGSPKLVRSSPGRGHGAMAVDLDVVGCC